MALLNEVAEGGTSMPKELGLGPLNAVETTTPTFTVKQLPLLPQAPAVITVEASAVVTMAVAEPVQKVGTTMLVVGTEAAPWRRFRRAPA